MPHPLLIFSRSDYLIQVVDTNLHTLHQTVQIQMSWLLQKPTDLDVQFAKNGRAYPGSAGPGLKNNIFHQKEQRHCKKKRETYSVINIISLNSENRIVDSFIFIYTAYIASTWHNKYWALSVSQNIDCHYGYPQRGFWQYSIISGFHIQLNQQKNVF